MASDVASRLGLMDASPLRASDKSLVAQRFFRNEELAVNAGIKTLTPEMAGWKYSGLAIIQLPPLLPVNVDATLLKEAEGALIPLSAVDVTVRIDDQEFLLNGRSGVFQGPTDWLYCAKGAAITVTSQYGGEIAIATAVSNGNFASCKVAALENVEIRGAGDATREVRPFMHPDIFANAERLMAVELVTPDGNVSSYPPHRHDGMGECRIANEEIYYFRIGKKNGLHGDPEGFGFHRTYAGDEYDLPFDDNVAIHDGDIYLVHHGYHGPCIALPGYPMYYLNVLAGSSPRSMDFCDDPNHAWIRKSWLEQERDPRVPWKVD